MDLKEKLKEISNRIKEDLLLHKGFTRITDNLTEKVKEYKTNKHIFLRVKKERQKGSGKIYEPIKNSKSDR